MSCPASQASLALSSGNWTRAQSHRQRVGLLNVLGFPQAAADWPARSCDPAPLQSAPGSGLGVSAPPSRAVSLGRCDPRGTRVADSLLGSSTQEAGRRSANRTVSRRDRRSRRPRSEATFRAGPSSARWLQPGSRRRRPRGSWLEAPLAECLAHSPRTTDLRSDRITQRRSASRSSRCAVPVR